MDANHTKPEDNTVLGGARCFWNGYGVYRLFQNLSPCWGRQCLVTLLIPITAIILGNVFLAEAIQSKEILGAFIIGTGLLFIDGRLIRRLVGKHDAAS